MTGLKAGICHLPNALFRLGGYRQRVNWRGKPHIPRLRSVLFALVCGWKAWKNILQQASPGSFELRAISRR
jgi:hypothetical protein